MRLPLGRSSDSSSAAREEEEGVKDDGARRKRERSAEDDGEEERVDLRRVERAGGTAELISRCSSSADAAEAVVAQVAERMPRRQHPHTLVPQQPAVWPAVH